MHLIHYIIITKFRTKYNRNIFIRVKLENEFAKLLNYESLLDKSTRGDESSIKVYDTLISSVNKNMKIYH